MRLQVLWDYGSEYWTTTKDHSALQGGCRSPVDTAPQDDDFGGGGASGAPRSASIAALHPQTSSATASVHRQRSRAAGGRGGGDATKGQALKGVGEASPEFWSHWLYTACTLQTADDAVYKQAVVDTATHLGFDIVLKSTETLPNAGKKWVFVCSRTCTFKYVCMRAHTGVCWTGVRAKTAHGTCLQHRGGEDCKPGPQCARPKVM
jgi:hypothetical protein